MLGVLGLYGVPRAWHLLFFDASPVTSAGLLRGDQERLIALTLCLIALAVICFALGHRSHRAATFGRNLRFSLPDPDRVRVWPVALAIGTVGFAALGLLLYEIGGISYALNHQAEMPTLFKGKGLLVQLIRLTIVPVGLLFRKPGTSRIRIIAWVIMVLAVSGLAVLGRRSFILEAFAYPILLYHLCVRPLPVRWILSLGPPLAIAVVGISYVRSIGLANLASAFRLLRDYPKLLSHFVFGSSGEFSIFDSLAILVRDVPHSFPYSYGLSYLRIPFMLIPRSLWYDKPVTLPVEITEHYLPFIKAGWPPTIIGELYVAGGCFAVAIGMFLWGSFCRAGWEWHKRHPGVGNATFYIMFCELVFDATRVGDASRSVLSFAIVTGFFILAFSLAAPQSSPDALERNRFMQVSDRQDG
jgi:hypothetical protein